MLTFYSRSLSDDSSQGVERVGIGPKGCIHSFNSSSFGGYLQVARPGRQLASSSRQETGLSSIRWWPLGQLSKGSKRRFNHPQEGPNVRVLAMFDANEVRLGRAGRLTGGTRRQILPWSPQRGSCDANDVGHRATMARGCWMRSGVSSAWGVSEEGRCSVVRALEGIRERETCHRVLPLVDN